jgi:hypothetical protein
MGMSAVPSKADMQRASRHVRFVPEADMKRGRSRPTGPVHGNCVGSRVRSMDDTAALGA